MKRICFLILIISFFIACDRKYKKTSVASTNSTIKKDSITDDDDTLAMDTYHPLMDTTKIGIEMIHQTDTFKNVGKYYVLQIIIVNRGIERDNWFIVKKKIGKEFKIILKDPDFGTNNSGLYLKDNNNDGYLDIIWDKKWQEHAYLFNPKIENFVEVGECHTIDTLKIGSQVKYYNKKYPLLYYVNEEKNYYISDEKGDTEWITDIHSEFFILDDNYEKISFGTLDNSASLSDWNAEKCQKTKKAIINCYIPPYKGKYGGNSIWNTGQSIDSFQVRIIEFNDKFIKKYWQEKYKKLIPHGQKFKVRRGAALEYY
jgi:hypothetical protein